MLQLLGNGSAYLYVGVYANTLHLANLYIVSCLFVVYRVSSVLNKDIKQFGKQNMFDGSDETCWNSHQVSHTLMIIVTHFSILKNPVIVATFTMMSLIPMASLNHVELMQLLSLLCQFDKGNTFKRK